MSNWAINDELVGTRVLANVGNDELEAGVVIAVSETTDLIRVRSDVDGEVLVGNRWEYAY